MVHRPASLAQVCGLDAVILSVPISAFKQTLSKIGPMLKPDTLVADVCSVKEYPVRWMREQLPETVSILATHPMFGPDSAAESLKNSKIVLCKERIDDRLYNRIKHYLESRGLIVIEASPDEHDRQIAVSLALTHFIGRSLSEFGAEALDIDTWLQSQEGKFLRGTHTRWRAAIAAALGDRRGALQLLHQAHQEGMGLGWDHHRDPEWEPLRDYQPYREMMGLDR